MHASPQTHSAPRRGVRSKWTRRMAWALAVWSFALLLVGGLVTTYRVGMAVPDWPTTFGYSMFTYPIDGMLADFGVFIEHSHRLIASVLGMLAIVALVVAWRAKESRAIIGMCAVVLLAISAQGVLGGMRVLHNDQQLAFLHGASAQIVYALIAALFVVTSPAWRNAQLRPCKTARSLQRQSILTVVVVYAQIVVGAWLRHSGLPGALVLHMALALAAVGALIGLAARLQTAHDAGAGHDRSVLLRLRRWVLTMLGLQVTLGILATAAIFGLSGGFTGRPAVAEVITATLHVGVGALLFGGCVASALWSQRLLSAPAESPAGAVAEGAA